jgi:hypothetical protein
MSDFRDLYSLNQTRLYFLNEAKKYNKNEHKHTYYLKKSHTISSDIYEYFENHQFILKGKKAQMNVGVIDYEMLNILHYMVLTDNFYCFDKIVSQSDGKMMLQLLNQKEEGFIQSGFQDYKQKTAFQMMVIKNCYSHIMKLDEKFNIINEENYAGLLEHLSSQKDSILGEAGQKLINHLMSKPLFDRFLQKNLNQKIKNMASTSFGNSDYCSLLEEKMVRMFSQYAFENFSKKINDLGEHSSTLLTSILEQRFINTVKHSMSSYQKNIPLMSDAILDTQLLSVMSFYKNEFHIELDMEKIKEKDTHIIQKMYDFAYKTPKFYYATEHIFDYTLADHEGNNFINYIFKQLGKYVPPTDIQQDLVIHLVQSNQFDLDNIIEKPKFHHQNVNDALKAILAYNPITEFPPLNRFKILLEKVLLNQSLNTNEKDKIAEYQAPQKRMKI